MDFDDSPNPDQFQDSGGLLGRLSSLSTQLGAGFQGWAQTPAGSPFAGLANGINAFNNAQTPNAASGAFIGPPAPASTPTQSPDFGDRLGSAFQSWAHTPVGNPFTALANGINAFNIGQTNMPGGGRQQCRRRRKTPMRLRAPGFKASRCRPLQTRPSAGQERGSPPRGMSSTDGRRGDAINSPCVERSPLASAISSRRTRQRRGAPGVDNVPCLFYRHLPVVSASF